MRATSSRRSTRLSAKLRALGVPVIWVLHANTQVDGRSDWELFFNHVVADDVRAKTLASLAPERQSVWHGLAVGPQDRTWSRTATAP